MSAAASARSAGTYLYCIAPGQPFGSDSPPLAARAIGGRGDAVYAIQYRDLAAIVSDSPLDRYDIGRENTIAHQLVTEAAMARGSVLPVRFGTVGRNTRQVERLLARQFKELHRLLGYVHERVELGVKVLWKRERLFAEIVAEGGRIRALRDAIAERPAEETYYQRLEIGKLIEEAMARKKDEESEAILETLRPLAAETKLNLNHTDMMLMNGAFLVDRAAEPAFDAAVSALGDAQAGRLIFKYAGPLPPFNFVSVSVQWDEA